MSRTERLTQQDERIVAAAEADLQRLLSVEPSPEFAARLRSRIHENRAAASKHWVWMGLGLAFAVTLILVVALRTNQSSPATQIVQTTHPDIVLVPDRQPQDMSPAIVIKPKHVAIHQQSQGIVPRVESPEIVIDSAMTDAIRRMAISLRNTSPDVSVAESLQVKEGDPAALTVADPLSVPELVVKPADQNGGNQKPL